MMNTDSFKRTVQTFGSNPIRWPEKQAAYASYLSSHSGVASLIMAEEKPLDDALDMFKAPLNPGLSERVYAAIINEQNKHHFFVFLRFSTVLSLLLLICGFYLGWQDAHQNFTNTQSYFSDMFNYTLNVMELYT